jgi:glycosyltransferase involved in cell wall biosynthesis
MVRIGGRHKAGGGNVTRHPTARPGGRRSYDRALAATAAPRRAGDDVTAGRTRVLWLIKGLGPGGAERLLVAAAARHDRDGFEFTAAYLLPWKDALVGELAARGVPSVCLDVRREQDLRWAWRLRRYLQEHPVDVVHVHSPYPAVVARLVARTLPRSRRPSIVYTTHNTWRSFRWPTRVLNGVTLPLDAADVVVSREAHASIWSRWRDRVEVVEHGVVLDEVRALRGARAEVRAEFGFTDREVVIGTVANLRANKDWPNLLGAARRVIDRGAPVRFVAVGQGPLEREVRAEHARLGLGDRVRLTGHREDAVRLMAGCDVFVLASYYEGLPVALMEAFALGLPVVATAVGGVPEMVTHGVEGLLVAPRDPDALATALVQVACDPTARAAMGEAASRRADRYDVTNAVRRMEAIYRDVVR